MKRYSIASSSSRRKSTVNAGFGAKDENSRDSSAHFTESSTLELERLEQEITLTLQEIDKNLSKSNAIINDKIFPVLKNYGKSSAKVWNNVNFWKYFMESSANVELAGYAEPANPSTDANTLSNSKTGNILLDDDDETVPEDGAQDRHQLAEDGRIKGTGSADFKRPYSKAFHNVIEETPTWSIEQHQQQHQQQQQPGTSKHIQSSTPLYTNKRASILGGKSITGTGRFDSSDSLKFQPPPTTTANIESPKFTHTIRQTLDTYHKISISPRKKTPVRESENRRSSIIQNLIESSPTLPEPPILLSELPTIKDFERLSPVRLQQDDEVTSKRVSEEGQRSGSKRASLQRFPSTPKYRSSGGYGSAPGSSSRSAHSSPAKAASVDAAASRPSTAAGLSSSEELPPIPRLQSVPLQPIRSPGQHDDARGTSKTPITANDDEDNVFLDTTSKTAGGGGGGGNSATSTIYHSVLKQTSRENTNNHSATYSLFQEVHETSKDKEGEGGSAEAGTSASPPNDIFGDIIPREEDVTGGSTGELGSFLTERFRNFTK